MHCHTNPLAFEKISKRSLLAHCFALAAFCNCRPALAKNSSANQTLKTIRLKIELRNQQSAFQLIEEFAHDNRFAVWREETRGDGVYWLFQLFRLDVYFIILNDLDKDVFSISIYETCNPSLTSYDPLVLVDGLVERLLSVHGISVVDN